MMVGLGIFKVNLLMGHVQIPADNHGFLRIQFAQVITEGIFPFHAVGKAFQFPLGIWRIDRHEKHFRKFQRDYPPLMVMFLNAQTIGDI